MKRYWKMITLGIVTVIVIGTFYIQSSLAATDVKIEFEKVSGNEDEVENLVLYAGYEIGNMHQTLQIANKETSNLENQSLFQEMIGGNMEPVFKNLIERYRGFMRGKELIPNSFYEDEHLLAYADIKLGNLNESSRNSAFDIEVLDKKSGETTSIQLELPKEDNNNWMDVAEVQVIDGDLKVFTRIFQSNGGGQELFLYSFDIEGKKLINKEAILATPTVKNGWSDLRLMNDSYSIQPEKYFMIRIEAYEERQGDGEMVKHPDAGPELLADEVFIYNIERNHGEKFMVPEDMLAILDSAAIVDPFLFFPIQTTEGLEVKKYDIEKKKWEGEKNFHFVHTVRDKAHPFVKIMNGKVYVTGSTENQHSLYISDLKTGESLYEGKLKVNHQKDNAKDYHLTIHEIANVQ